MTAIAEPEVLTRDAARALTDEIKGRVSDLLPLIKRAFDERADQALGYANWADYCSAELSGIRVPLDDRPAMVGELRANGMSTRAIGSALGVTHTQVQRDLNRLERDVPVAQPEKVLSLDGRSRPASMPEKPGPVEAAEEESPLPGMPEGQERADAFMAGVDAVEDAAEPSPEFPVRPAPPKWDPEDRKRHGEEVARIRDVQAARDQSKTIVTDVLAAVCVVVAGCRYGETGLVTQEMITKLREAIDLLEGEL